jgi:hypothetical protein
MTDRWVNPPRKPKTENEFPYLAYPQNEIPPQNGVPYSHTTTFNRIKKQVGKKKISKKTKKERIADKSVSLAERLNDKLINRSVA